MDIVVPDVGEIYHLNKIRLAYNQSFELRTFKNDYSPGADSQLSDFEESDWGGYAPKDLAGDWGLPSTNPDGEAEITAPFQTWDAPSGGDPQDIWGVYATANGGNDLLWAQRAEQAHVMEAGGEAFSYGPIFRLRAIALT